jgi:hypothetical protein
MTIDDLISPHTIAAVHANGLHKIAAVFAGMPPGTALTLGDAACALGMKAYQRRKEARSIADGIAAYAALTNEKIAENPALTALLQRSVMPALAGAGIAAIPHVLSNDPYKGSVLPSLAAGGLMGGTGGALNAIHGLPEGVSQSLAKALAKQ